MYIVIIEWYQFIEILLILMGKSDIKILFHLYNCHSSESCVHVIYLLQGYTAVLLKYRQGFFCHPWYDSSIEIALGRGSLRLWGQATHSFQTTGTYGLCSWNEWKGILTSRQAAWLLPKQYFNSLTLIPNKTGWVCRLHHHWVHLWRIVVVHETRPKFQAKSIGLYLMFISRLIMNEEITDVGIRGSAHIILLNYFVYDSVGPDSLHRIE